MGVGEQIALSYAAMMKLAWPSVFTRIAPLGLVLALIPSCQAPMQAEAKSQVLVLGMIHRDHLNSEDFGIEVVQDLVRNFGPDYMLVEIPPERMPEAMSGFLATGELTEERARIFPEYRDAIFPLLHEIDFEIIGCAGWTKEMAVDRRTKLARWAISRAEQSAEVNAAQALADALDQHRGEGKRFIVTFGA
jgi:hypothetical protein